jgi:hypothetical protein
MEEKREAVARCRAMEAALSDTKQELSDAQAEAARSKLAASQVSSQPRSPST